MVDEIRSVGQTGMRERGACDGVLQEGAQAGKALCSDACYQLARKAAQRASCDNATMNQDDTWMYNEATELLSRAWV